jgi:hypothetical protein
MEQIPLDKITALQCDNTLQSLLEASLIDGCFEATACSPAALSASFLEILGLELRALHFQGRRTT